MTNNIKTREACDAFVASRKEAGRVIDIEPARQDVGTRTTMTPTGSIPTMMTRLLMM